MSEASFCALALDAREAIRIDLAHPAGAEGGNDFVRPESNAGTEKHIGRGTARIIARGRTYNWLVKKSELEDVLRILQEATEQAAQIRIELTEDYLALIDQVEAMPQNQAGAVKVDRWPGIRSYIESFSRVERAPRKT